MKNNKYYHFTACLIVALVISISLSVLGAHYLVCAFGAFATALGTGIGKEYGDYSKGYPFDPHDIAADALGALTGALIGACFAL